MRLLPMMTYEIRAAATPAELAGLLQSQLEPARPFLRLSSLKPFCGRVDLDGFRITRVGRTRNFFRPTVYGTFEAADRSTTVRISIHHEPWIFVVVALFSLFFAAICQRTAIPFVSAMVAGEPTSSFKAALSVLAIVGIFLFAFSVSWLEFPSEASAVKEELDQLLDAVSIGPR